MPAAPPVTASVEINLGARNDVHGNIDRSKFTDTSVSDPARKTLDAGGIDTLSGALAAWRKEDGQGIFVGNGDRIGAISAILPALRAQGVGEFVVLLQQGGETEEAVDQADCRKLKGPVADIAKRLDPALQVLISGHSHKRYLCRVDGPLVTQAAMGGIC